MQDLTKEAALPSVEASPTVREIRALEARLQKAVSKIPLLCEVVLYWYQRILFCCV